MGDDNYVSMTDNDVARGPPMPAIKHNTVKCKCLDEYSNIIYIQYIIYLFINILIISQYSNINLINIVNSLCYIPVYLAKQLYRISLYLVNYNNCQHDINHTLNEYRAELNEHRAEINNINNILDKLNDIFVKNKKYNVELTNIRNRLQKLEYNSLNF